MHDAAAALPRPSSADPVVPNDLARPQPLIRGLRLLTAVPLATMRAFYHDRLGLAVADERAESITFQAGLTPLTFVTATPGRLTGKGGRGNGQPFYHFAFNIPQNKILAARNWQLQRSALVPTPENLRDPAYPDDVRHFRNWNAHSVFFFDPAFNIVEYIARHDLKNDAPDPEAFSVKDILYASEIGFVSDQPQRDRNAKLLHEKLGLKAYPPGTADDWWAMGDEHGLLLCLGNQGEVWGDNTDTPVTWDVWETQVTVRGGKTGELILQGLPYQISVESD
jgi:catechol-2,3-dioxygenase